MIARDAPLIRQERSKSGTNHIMVTGRPRKPESKIGARLKNDDRTTVMDAIGRVKFKNDGKSRTEQDLRIWQHINEVDGKSHSH